MTDRELLELAAKAAGIGTLVWDDKYKFGEDEIDCTDMPYFRSGQPGKGDVFWDPIADDGDALRLAVTCGLVVDCSRPSAGEPYKQHAIWLDETMSNAELTRRAIVRAAAEIGGQMP